MPKSAFANSTTPNTESAAKQTSRSNFSTRRAIGMVISASQSSETPRETTAQQAFALGIGLTNECNLACSFCYRDPTRVDRLPLEQVRSVLKSLPVRSVNLGTGENGMHPDFSRFVDYDHL